MTACWFGGYVGHQSETDWPGPKGSRMLWAGRFPVWCSGDWPGSEIRILPGRQRVAVIGACAAGDLTFAARDEHGLVTEHAGSYTVIQATAEELRVFTDLGFAWPVYLARCGSGTVWCSSARMLAGLTGAKPDPAWLAAALIDPSAPAQGSRSPFEGIESVPPGSRICLRPGRPPAITPAVRMTRRSRPEAASALRSALDGCVGTWIRSAKRPGSNISGLDSGSVCMLAVRHVRPPARLTAVTVHPAGRDDGADLSCACRALRHCMPADHWLLPLGPEHLPGTDLDQFLAADEPPPSTFTWSRLAAEFALLARLGIDVHLTGDGGDTLFYPGPGYLADLARSGHWLRLATHTQGWARLQKSSPWPLLARAIRGRDQLPRAPWITGLAAEMAPRIRSRDADYGQLTLLEIQAVGRSARADAQLAETFGIMLRNPFTGSAVIDAALSVPAWERGDPWHYKPLLTDALEGLLPPAIAGRTTKGAFDAEHHRGMRANLPALLSLADGHLAALGLVNPPRLRAAVRNAAAGLPTSFGLLEPTLAAETWLRAIAQAPQHAWSRCEIPITAVQERA